MRLALLLFIVPATFSSGCAGLIAESGTNLANFKTTEDLHAKFGEPCAIGPVVEGTFKKGQETPKHAAFYEDFLTRRIIATPYKDGLFYGIAFAMSLGTVELFLIPEEMFLKTERTILGQTLRVIYDADGKVVGGQLDGETINLQWSRLWAPW